MILSSTEFDFNKTDLSDSESGDALKFVSQAVGKSAPAHAIPLISLEVTDDPDTAHIGDNCLPHISIDREEIDVGAGNNVFASGIFLNTYKRGIDTDGNVIGRFATQSLASPQMLTVSTLANVSRNTARRRSYEKVMPFNGYYDRTGFNMPVSFDMSHELSGVPLGLIPSSLSYTPVSSHINLPDIWAQCEGLNSDNTYYEYDVSNTQNTRGQATIFKANADRTTDRGQLPGIYAAMHRIEENRKYLNAVLDIKANLSSLNEYLDELYFVLPFHEGFEEAYAIILTEIQRVEALLNNDYQSHVTSGSNANSPGYTFPASINDYYNFEFGRDLHRLYKIYQDKFKWHRLSPDIQDQDGANIFSHTFGPLLYNHNFEKLGISSDQVATSFANPLKLNVSSSSFTGTGSFVASDASDMYLDTFERVSSGLVEALELVLTSGTEADSSFSILRVPASEKLASDDPFLYDRTLVLMRSGQSSAARLRFDISKYGAAGHYPITTNFLTPEHEFEINLSSLISRDSGTTLGGRSIGVWIHTKPENGTMFSFTPKGVWTEHNQLISRNDMITKYAHTKQLAARANDPNSSNSTTNFACLDQVTTNRTSPVIGLGASSFENFTVNFNTRNRDLRLSYNYHKQFEQLHRSDQNYVIEVFMSPGAEPDEFMLVDKLEVQDLTLNALSKIFAAGTRSNPLCKLPDLKKGCLEYRFDLSKQDIFDIFKHFNNIAGKNAATAYASRDKAKTATIMESEGGSRIEYRLSDGLLKVIYGTVGTTAAYKSEVRIPV